MKAGTNEIAQKMTLIFFFKSDPGERLGIGYHSTEKLQRFVITYSAAVYVAEDWMSF